MYLQLTNTFLSIADIIQNHIIGGLDCLSLSAKEFGVTNPKALKSMKLRKQVATLSQRIRLIGNLSGP